MQVKCLFDVIVLSHVLYEAPAWRGNLSAAEMECLQQLFVKAKWSNIVLSIYDVDALLTIVIKPFLDHLYTVGTVYIIYFWINKNICHDFKTTWS